MSFYEFIRQCEENGLDWNEALDEWYKYCDERHRRFEEEYYSDSIVCEGWAQQDMIDMYRRER